VIVAHPLEFQVGPIPITGFGLTMMLAFLIGAWLIDRELRRQQFTVEFGGDIVLGAVIGGIVGAKLWFAALHGPETLFSRDGLVYYGGFVGGALGVVLMSWRRRVPIRWTAHLVAPALAAAYAVGRVGCFVVGDDYGRPTTLPWAVAFPEGLPPSTAANLAAFRVAIPAGTPPDAVLAVHPTQLYEVLAMLAVFALLWRWRTRPAGTGWLFGAYLVFAGIERFLVEFLRAKDDRLLGPLTYAQGMSVVLIVAGAITWNALAKRPPADPGEWLRKGDAGGRKAASRPA
jgi:phosphatidylglycerol:prolipoprotein diacylglycerol transferase